MGWIYLGIITFIATAIWPVAKWTLKDDGSPRVMGFWLSLTAATVSAVSLLVRGGTFATTGVWIAGAVMSVAYAVGFIILIMRCLQIGPAGPTVTVNNSMMVCGVLYGVVWLDPHLPDPWILCGAIGVVVGLAFVGLGNRTGGESQERAGAEWARLIALGGALSGVSFMSQSYVGLRHPGMDSGLLFSVAGFGLSAAILLLTLVRESREFVRRRRELAGGILLGIGNGIGLPLTTAAFEHLGAEIVLPVTVASPMVLVTLIGAIAYREKLTRLMWLGCILAAFSIAAIAYGSA